MVRTAYANNSVLHYLQGLAKPETCSVGIILGQTYAGKDYIIHLTKTPSRSKDKEDLDDLSQLSENKVGDHALATTRMLPGGMHVLGIFIVSHENVITPFNAKIKSTLAYLYKLLGSNPLLYGNPEINERLVLHYSSKTQLYTAKSYDIISAALKPAEFKFTAKVHQWVQLECLFDLMKIIPIKTDENNRPLKKQITDILNDLQNLLKTGVFLYDGEPKDAEALLETITLTNDTEYNQKFKVKECFDGEEELIQVSILVPLVDDKTSPSTMVYESKGDIKISGQVASKLWLNPKMNIKAASDAVMEDIMRSLASRLDMHWDSLIEGEQGLFNETSSIHEPPRRVLVTLPHTQVNLSDYLFPGEGAQEAQLSIQDILDIDIITREAITDIEGQADIAELLSEDGEQESTDSLVNKLPTDTNKFMYLVGGGVAVLVLIISLILNYLKK